MNRFKLMILVISIFASLIILFGVLSQPIAIISDVLDDAYPDDYSEGKDQNTNIQFFIPLALGAVVVIGIIFLFGMYGYKSMGGGKHKKW